MRAFLLSILLALFITRAANSQPTQICMSDGELHSFLTNVHVYNIGQGLGICLRRYPSLQDRILNAYDSFEGAYSAEIRETAEATLLPFEKFCPGCAEAAYEQYAASGKIAAQVQLERYSLAECTNFVAGVEIVVRADSWNAVLVPVRMAFDLERNLVPRCP